MSHFGKQTLGSNIMNLLVTNTRNAQAYTIIRALRPYAQTIVVTMYGKSPLAARLSHAANSRLVDKRYHVPSPVEDWRAGNIQRENTEREETYIRTLLRICERDKIDTIFPSFDPQVYVLSKNKERFEKIGVMIPIPDLETVITPLDKYRTIQAAQDAGFPCPRTWLPESENDLRRIVKEIGFPLVIKPRFTSAGRGTAIVKDAPELFKKTRLVEKSQGMPLIQEYIPGKENQVFHLVLNRRSELKVGFCHKRWRDFPRGTFDFPTAVESAVPHHFVARASQLVRTLGWWGAAQVQTKIDPRDGIPKLMEINARLGYVLWNRTELGINEPLMCLKIARAEEVDTVKDYPVGIMLLDPIEDMLGLGYKLLDLAVYKCRIRVQGMVPIDPLNAPMNLKELFQSYRQSYFGGKKIVFNPYFRYFLQDPLVSILWWFQFCSSVIRAGRQLGI